MVAFVMNDEPKLIGAPNFRDLGGHVAGDGARVRRGLVYRADAMAGLHDADIAVLQEIGLRQMIDLRTDVERERGADRVPEGVEHVVLDVQGRHSTGGDLATILTDPRRALPLLEDGGAVRFMHAVSRALVTSGDACAAYGELVQRAATGPTAVVFHCSAGKDRTGWGAALILTLLGVPREAVVADYMASNDRRAGVREWLAAKAEGNGIAPDLFAPMLEVRMEYLQTAFAEIDRVYGSFETYAAEGLNLTAETIELLRARMLE